MYFSIKCIDLYHYTKKKCIYMRLFVISNAFVAMNHWQYSFLCIFLFFSSMFLLNWFNRRNGKRLFPFFFSRLTHTREKKSIWYWMFIFVKHAKLPQTRSNTVIVIWDKQVYYSLCQGNCHSCCFSYFFLSFFFLSLHKTELF